MALTSPNTILTVDDIRARIPALTEDISPDVTIQDYIDNALSQVIERLGVDISGGVATPITQTFRWEDFPQRSLKLRFPCSAVTSITQDNPAVTVPTTDYIVYPNYITRNPGTASYYWFDKVQPLYPGFLPIVTVIFTGRDTAFRVVKDTLLRLIRLEMDRYDILGGGDDAFSMLLKVKDELQEKWFAGENTEESFNAAYDDILTKMVVKLRGVRIG